MNFINTNKKKTLEQVFEDTDKKLDEALKLAEKLNSPVDSSFWKYFQIKSSNGNKRNG